MPEINGFTVSDDRSEIGIKTYRVPGTNVLLPVRSEIAPLLIGMARDFNRYVEPLRPGWCWGYAYRQVRGGGSWSFHSAGIAIDLNSVKHFYGARNTFSPRQASMCRALARKYGLRWGGDYRRTADEMHFEVILPRDRALVLARQVSNRPPRRRYPALQNLRYRHEHPDIKLLQVRLRAIGYQPGVIDGIYGSRTRAAVAAFQRKQGWSGSGADGLMGPLTYYRLFGRKP